MQSWMIRNRSLRSKGRPPPEDCYRLDVSKTPAENAYDIYLTLCSRMTNENKRLSLLNALVNLIVQNKNVSLGFSTEEFLYCISASLTHQFTQIRAASLRVLRHLLNTPKDIQIFNTLQLPHLVCRSLDILLKNEEERVQALKLVRRMLGISPELISPVLVRCLVSLGESGVEDGDRMLRACLATLCEFGILNSTLMIMCGGVNAITRNVLECHSPRIAESLCGVLLHLLEWPHTRNIAAVRLDCLAAPYCDFTYRLGIMDKNKDARDLRFTCSRLALLSVLRSWAGLIEFCDPNRPSGLKAIIDILYLNQLEVRKAILDLLYELLGLPQPVWTDEYNVALSVVDPADFQDSWRLSEGFVAMEGRFVLPTLANCVPNICEIHLSVLLYCFLETGLLNALIEVIVSSDTFISVRATVLLGKLLQLMHTLLPADICNNSPALPKLITKATEGNHQARAAVAGLQSFHHMLKNRPASCSLFLDNIIQSGNIINTKVFKREISINECLTMPPKLNTIERKRLDSVGSNQSITPEVKDENVLSSSFLSGIKRSSIRRTKLLNIFDGYKESDRLIKLSNVSSNQDVGTWDWEIVVAIFKSDLLGKIDDYQIKFIKRLVHFFKPSSNRFSHQDLGHGRHIHPSVLAGVEIIDWLLQASSHELEMLRMLTDLFTDISNNLLAIYTSRSAHECLFSPQHMGSTMCQHYFLFIGRLCKTEKGLSILKNTNIFKQMKDIVENTNHVCYIKLIVSGLDYILDSFPRSILRKALTTSKLRAGRLYATQFLLVLLRAKIPNFEIWGLPLLITQVRDKERSVVLAALEILDEACHERTYLEELVNIWPNLETVGDAGKLIVTRFYSIPRGLNHPNAQIKEEIEKWKNEYNKRYVLLIEADTHASMTLHYKNEDGTYSRRSCSSRPTIIPPNVLPHLYGQLVQTSQGMCELQKHGNLPQLIDQLNMAKCNDETESLNLKAALWALGHASTSVEGIEFLNDPISRIYEKIIYLAKHFDVYSIRATALNVLGLIGSTNAGANILYKLDWYCVRHNRNTYWPVCEPEDWLSKHLSPVRHQIGEVPPYNYSAIDDTEFFSDGSNSFYFDETSNDVNSRDIKDLSIIERKNNGEVGTTVRSKTMPDGTLTQKRKHTGSLSESRTTDGLSLMSATQYQSSVRTRFNSGTDSNTSGVSSCDSIFGKIFVPDLQQTTLSPIPSSSNLLDMKKPNEERFRRISLTGVPLKENILTPQDLQGYATLRSLRRHCRPMLSESAADELVEMIESDNIIVRNKKQTSEIQRKLKVRSLDRHGRLLTAGVEEFQSSNSSTTASTTTRLLNQCETRGPCYSGICLPKNILDLFPHRNINVSYITRCAPDADTLDSGALSSVKQQFLNDSIIEGDESCVSSLSDISVNSKKCKWAGKHVRSLCLHCCRSKVNKFNLRTDSDINMQRRKSNHSSLVQLSDVSFNSPESVFSEESVPDRITTNILRHVQRMSNPVWSKQSKMALLELKQKHALSFQDICLYSEVCKLLGKSTYRLNARRFLQEIFLDLDFDCFFNEPNDIIFRKDKNENLNNDENQSEQQTVLHIKESVNSSSCEITNTSDNNNISTTTITSSTTGQNHQTSAHFNLIKSHLKSPPLESVYEASAENLSESFSSKSLKTQQNQTNFVCNLNKNENINYRRPRFHTLELDLSCTKNKFPITERRKTFSPNSLSNSNRMFTQSFTTSLSPTVTTPSSTLYCEKRLELSKSEATLSKSKK